MLMESEKRSSVRMLVVALAVVGVLTAVIGLLRSGGEPPASPGRAPLADVAAVAYRFAAANGEPEPASMRAVYTDGLSAERLAYDRGAKQGPSGEVALITAHGHFTAYMASRPQGAKPPVGTELYIILDPQTLAVRGWGVSEKVVDLASVGSPIALSRP